MRTIKVDFTSNSILNAQEPYKKDKGRLNKRKEGVHCYRLAGVEMRWDYTGNSGSLCKWEVEKVWMKWTVEE